MKSIILVLSLFYFLNAKGEDSCDIYLKLEQNNVNFLSNKVNVTPIKLPKGFWNDQRLSEVARLLYQLNVRPLFLESLKSNPLQDASETLKSKFGYAFSGASIENYVRKQKKYQLWVELLAEIGHSRNIPQLTRERIRSVFKARQNANLPNSQKQIELDDSPWFQKLLFETFGQQLTPWAFYQKYYWAYGSHDNAFQAFEFLEIATFKEDKLIEALLKIRREFGDEYLLTKKLETLTLVQLNLKDITGEFTTAKKLLKYVRLAFGSWENGLKAADIKLETQRVQWTKYKLSKTIELLRNSFGDANLSLQFLKSLTEIELAFLKPLLGSAINGKALILHYTKGIGWYESLEKAGVDVTKLRVLAVPDKNNFPLIIQKIAGIISPSSAAVDRLTQEDLLFLVPYMGKPVSGLNVREMASRHYGSWDNALIAAGFNPDQIRKKAWTNYLLLNIFYQKERTQYQANYDAIVGKAVGQFVNDELTAVVVESKSTESVYVRNKFEDIFYQAQALFSERELYIFNEVLKIIDASLAGEVEAVDLIDVLDLVINSLTDIPKEEILRFFDKIRENTDLRNAFVDLITDSF